jgi:hypothetical protein
MREKSLARNATVDLLRVIGEAYQGSSRTHRLSIDQALIACAHYD